MYRVKGGAAVADEVRDRYVVRLSCGHETLEVVSVSEIATPVGGYFTCNECQRRQQILESFRVDP
jgi:hypothetical protein